MVDDMAEVFDRFSANFFLRSLDEMTSGASLVISLIFSKALAEDSW